MTFGQRMKEMWEIIETLQTDKLLDKQIIKKAGLTRAHHLEVVLEEFSWLVTLA